MLFQVSRAELARVYVASYQGRRARACLAINPGGLTVNSTIAQWDAAEITSQAANGYARYVWTVGAGSYDAVSDLHRGANELATFTASPTGTGLQFDTLYVVTGTLAGGVTTWDTLSLVLPFNPSVALSPGEPRDIEIPFLVDDITSLPAV